MSLWAEGSHLGISTKDNYNELKIIEDKVIDTHMEILVSSQKRKLKICEKDQGLLIPKGWELHRNT